MNREEAIRVLSSYDVNGVWADVDGKPYNAEEQAEAFDMAIQALEREQQRQEDIYECQYCFGEVHKNYTYCPFCGEIVEDE